jgi:hypothetical protein
LPDAEPLPDADFGGGGDADFGGGAAVVAVAGEDPALTKAKAELSEVKQAISGADARIASSMKAANGDNGSLDRIKTETIQVGSITSRSFFRILTFGLVYFTRCVGSITFRLSYAYFFWFIVLGA